MQCMMRRSAGRVEVGARAEFGGSGGGHWQFKSAQGGAHTHWSFIKKAGNLHMYVA